jgi:hypothetical protein
MVFDREEGRQLERKGEKRSNGLRALLELRVRERLIVLCELVSGVVVITHG